VDKLEKTEKLSETTDKLVHIKILPCYYSSENHDDVCKCPLPYVNIVNMIICLYVKNVVFISINVDEN
jgi:hypothetical protein